MSSVRLAPDPVAEDLVRVNFEEQIKHARIGGPAGQLGDLTRARPLQFTYQDSHGVRVIEGGADDIFGQRGDLLMRACLPQLLQQAREGGRAIGVVGDVGRVIDGLPNDICGTRASSLAACCSAPTVPRLPRRMRRRRVYGRACRRRRCGSASLVIC